MSNTWFRLYSEILHDPKVQKLSGETFKLWINILCLACNGNGTLPKLDDCSFALRMPFHETKKAFHELENLGLIETYGETFHVHNWKKRQYKSDTSTERVRRFRKQKGNVSETPPDTDTEQNRTDPKPIGGGSTPPHTETFHETLQSEAEWIDRQRIGMDLPPERLEECKNEMGWPENVVQDVWTKFSAHFRRKIGQSALKTSEEWSAEWRTWYRKENIRSGKQAPPKSITQTPIKITPEYEEKQRVWYREKGVYHNKYNPMQ